MNIHFNLELSSRTGSKSEKSVLIRLTQNRQRRRISTGIKTEENHWDSKVQRVKKSHPLAVEYNSILQTKLKEVTHAYSILLEEDSQVTSEELSAAHEAFSSFINNPTLNAAQIRFVNMIIQYLATNGVITADKLFESPFTEINGGGLLGVFSIKEAESIVRTIESVNQLSLAN